MRWGKITYYKWECVLVHGMILILVFSSGIHCNHTQNLFHVVYPLCLPSKKLFQWFQGIIFISNKYLPLAYFVLLKITIIWTLYHIVHFGLLLDISVAILWRVSPIAALIFPVTRCSNPYCFFCACILFEKDWFCSRATPILSLTNIVVGMFF